MRAADEQGAQRRGMRRSLAAGGGERGDRDGNPSQVGVVGALDRRSSTYRGATRNAGCNRHAKQRSDRVERACLAGGLTCEPDLKTATRHGTRERTHVRWHISIQMHGHAQPSVRKSTMPRFSPRKFSTCSLHDRPGRLAATAKREVQCRIGASCPDSGAGMCGVVVLGHGAE